MATDTGSDGPPRAALTLGTGTVRLVPPDLVHPGTPPVLAAPMVHPDLLSDAGRAGGCITDDPPDAATFTAHIVLGNSPADAGRVVRMSPVVQPVRDNAGGWTFPPGLQEDLFKALAQLEMDAVEATDVAHIQQLGQAWLADQAANQPIRMRDDLSSALGHTTFSAAKAHWLAL